MTLEVLPGAPQITFRGYIDGLILSNDATSPNTVLDVSAGACRDSTDAYFIALPAAVTKTTGAFVAGSGNGALDIGTVTASTWYHVYAISKAGGAVPDVLFSLSATAPTMPSTYTLKRRIGSFRTNASTQITKFKQDGDEFVWDTPVSDVNATNPGTAAVTRTLTVPTGVRVLARMTAGFTTSALGDNPASVYISDLSVADVAATPSVLTFICYSASAVINNAFASCATWTNTSSQVRSRLQVSAAGTVLVINTLGWMDPRGKNAP